MLEIKDKKNCCGCNACGDACPHGAITFERDEGGFLYPVIDKDKCINCDICIVVCPLNSVARLRNENIKKLPEAYAAISNNLEIRFDSTSGGIFTVLANSIFDSGGFVGGAIWDDDFLVHHYLTNNPKDIIRLRSSKYAQSNASGFYLDVKEKLEKGYKVLVCGLPCQMVALRSFLRHNYDNLLIVDLICRSVSSPYFLQYYLRMHEQVHKSKIILVKQKDKGLGWRKLTTKLEFENGDIVYDPKDVSLFMRAFEENLISRPSCYDCKYRGFPRLADITLADCWGAVDKLPSNMDHNLGTSLVLCNTEKGLEFWEKVSSKQNVSCCKVDLNDAINGNFGLLSSIPYPSVDVSHLYEDLKSKPMPDVLAPLLQSKKNNQSKKEGFVKRYLRRIYYLLKSLINRFRKILACENILTVIRLNGIHRLIRRRALIIPNGNFVFDISEKASLIVNQDTTIGVSLLKKDKGYSRLKMYDGSRFIVNGGSIGRDCYLLLFEKSILEIGRNCCINVNFTISCAKHIKIGDNVFIGQHVTIRDTHGDHYINKPDYTPTSPIEIGDHVWICSDAMIMPGVKIGAGSVVAAKALVTHDVPPASLVAGIPAKVIRTNVQFRC